jgi:hypothetical protein
MSISDRQKTNFAWVLAGLVVVLVTYNTYSSAIHYQHIADPINNKNESEHVCPSISIPSH